MLRRLLFSVSLFLSVQSHALGTYTTLSGGSPLPTAYAASTPSRVMTCRNANVVEVLNYTTGVIAWGWSQSSSSTPTEDYSFVPAGSGSGNTFHLAAPLGNAAYLYVRAPTAQLTSGYFTVACWYEVGRP